MQRGYGNSCLNYKILKIKYLINKPFIKTRNILGNYFGLFVFIRKILGHKWKMPMLLYSYRRIINCTMLCIRGLGFGFFADRIPENW